MRLLTNSLPSTIAEVAEQGKIQLSCSGGDFLVSSDTALSSSGHAKDVLGNKMLPDQ